MYEIGIREAYAETFAFYQAVAESARCGRTAWRSIVRVAK